MREAEGVSQADINESLEAQEEGETGAGTDKENEDEAQHWAKQCGGGHGHRYGYLSCLCNRKVAARK